MNRKRLPLPRAALLAAVIVCGALVPAWADDLPVVYHGPTSPAAEFGAPYAIRVLSGGSVIEISGSFSRAVPPNFVAVLAQAPQVRTVRLESPGGYVQPAIAVGKIIQARGLDTYVGRFCASARTLAFLGGHDRFLAPEARLGFHQAHAPDAPPKRADPVLRQVYNDAGVPPAFIDHVLQTPPRALWFPAQNELRDAGITTGAPPPDLLVAENAVSPEWVETIKQMRWASDEGLIQFATVSADILAQLQQASPAICWDFMHREPADFETHVKHETLDALAAALRLARDDVKQAPAMGLDAAEKASILATLGASLPAESRGPTVAALRADGEPATFCPAVRTMLRAALAMPAASRGPALRALLSGG
jgi:hypothetical protein